MNEIPELTNWRRTADPQVKFMVEQEIQLLISQLNQAVAKIVGMESLVRTIRDCSVGTVITQELKDEARELLPL